MERKQYNLCNEVQGNNTIVVLYIQMFLLSGPILFEMIN